MKKAFSLLLVLAILAACFGATAVAEAAEVAFTPGTYEGKATSTGGELIVSVTVSDHAIESIEIVRCNDTDGIKNVPLERIPAQILENQSLNVDAVSGATLTSLFLRNAITDAVKKATDDVSGLNEKIEYKAAAQSNMQAAVVVVGGGSAGLAAAAQAGTYGLNVVLIERNAFLGGTSLVCDAVIFETPIEYMRTAEEPLENLFKSAGIQSTKVGVDYGGLPFNMIAAQPDEGRSIMGTAMAYLEKYAAEHNVTILKDTSVTGLIVEGGTVTGVTAVPRGQESFSVSAKAVILATGGFARNHDLVNQYMPQYAEARNCNMPGAHGEAIEWVSELDGKLINMDAGFQWFPASAALAAHSLGSANGGPMVYVNQEGNTINDGYVYSDCARDAFIQNGNDTFYQIQSPADVAATMNEAVVEHGLSSGSVFEFHSVAEIAEAYNLPNLEETMSGLGYAAEDTYYVCPVKPYAYSTYGGIDIDKKGHVLNSSDEIIPGLYAAGEVTGSVDYKNFGVYLGQVGQGMEESIIAARTITEEIG